jgi:hypothetical protein
MRSSLLLVALALPTLAACGGTDSALIDGGGTDATLDGTTLPQDGSLPPEDGSSPDGGPPPADGGTDALVRDGGSNPGQIDCASTTCTAGQQICCVIPPDGGSITPDAGLTRVCSTPQMCQGPEVRCDEKADCPMGEICCFNSNNGSASLSTRCGQTCGTATQVCKTDQECGGGTCGTYNCGPAGIVRACTKPLGCN